MAQRRKIARICTPFKAYIGEGAWKSIGERLTGIITIVKLRPGNKEQISVNTDL